MKGEASGGNSSELSSLAKIKMDILPANDRELLAELLNIARDDLERAYAEQTRAALMVEIKNVAYYEGQAHAIEKLLEAADMLRKGE